MDQTQAPPKKKQKKKPKGKNPIHSHRAAVLLSKSRPNTLITIEHWQKPK